MRPQPMTLYFAYGSNLDLDQMARRCPRSRLVGPAELHGYQLAFAGQSATWGGAVATVLPASAARVEGLVFQLAPGELEDLDRYEGYPFAYERALMELSSGQHAVVYFKAAPELGLPSREYLLTLAMAYQAQGFELSALLYAAFGGER